MFQHTSPLHILSPPLGNYQGLYQKLVGYCYIELSDFPRKYRIEERLIYYLDTDEVWVAFVATKISSIFGRQGYNYNSLGAWFKLI